MPTKTVAPTVLSACVLILSVVNLQLFGNSTALAQNPNNLQVLFREYDSTLNYDCAQGTCQFVTSGREVDQQDIVLAFHKPSARQYTDYEIA
jgi:hypothetical protein